MLGNTVVVNAVVHAYDLCTADHAPGDERQVDVRYGVPRLEFGDRVLTRDKSSELCPRRDGGGAVHRFQMYAATVDAPQTDVAIAHLVKQVVDYLAAGLELYLACDGRSEDSRMDSLDSAVVAQRISDHRRAGRYGEGFGPVHILSGPPWARPAPVRS